MEVDAENLREEEGLLCLRCEAWTGFCWQAESVLELFGLSIGDCGERYLRLMHAMPRLMKAGLNRHQVQAAAGLDWR